MMIKAILHKTFSVTLSCLVLFSTLSFTVEKHYCGNHLVDVAIFTKAENCGMDLEAFSTANFEKKHCCKDEIQVVKGQDKLKKSSLSISNGRIIIPPLKFHFSCFHTHPGFTFSEKFKGDLGSSTLFDVVI